MSTEYIIEVTVSSRFVEEQSAPSEGRYVFAYHIRIRNSGQGTAQLISRHWIITDANGKVQEVQGEGVVGEQPTLAPGESFEYTSGCTLSTPFGSMKGSYQMLGSDGEEFDAGIPEFSLLGPRVLH